jgi:hypothetical protein
MITISDLSRHPLLVVPASPWAGLASTCLGLVRALDRRGVRVAFVKPVAQPLDNGAADRSAALVAAVSPLRPPDPVPAAEVKRELSDGGLDAVLEKIVAAWQPVYGQSEVVVIEAVSPGPARLYAAGFNQALAQALDARCGAGRPMAAGCQRRGGGGRARGRGGFRRRPGLGMPRRTWPSRSPSRRAATSPARTRVWSAAWSTTCPATAPIRRSGCARPWPGAGCG